MRVSPYVYAEAAGLDRQQARQCLAPKSILDKIINFLTFGGRTREGLKNLALFQQSLYQKLSECQDGKDLPSSITLTFLDQTVVLSATKDGRTEVKVGEGESQACAELATDYKHILLKAKLKHTTLAKDVNTAQSERANSVVINNCLKEHLKYSGLQLNKYADDMGNQAFSLKGDRVTLLSTQSMVTWNSLKNTCDALQKQANENGKTLVTPLGMINRPGFHEAHCVTLVCRPGLGPLIVDSKDGPRYPSGIEVVVTGNQSFFDRTSCWAQSVQQCVHYACQLQLGISEGQLEPYINS